MYILYICIYIYIYINLPAPRPRPRDMCPRFGLNRCRILFVPTNLSNLHFHSWSYPGTFRVKSISSQKTLDTLSCDSLRASGKLLNSCYIHTIFLLAGKIERCTRNTKCNGQAATTGLPTDSTRIRWARGSRIMLIRARSKISGSCAGSLGSKTHPNLPNHV